MKRQALKGFGWYRIFQVNAVLIRGEEAGQETAWSHDTTQQLEQTGLLVVRLDATI